MIFRRGAWTTAFCAVTAATAGLIAASPSAEGGGEGGDRVTVEPRQIDDVLVNPNMGFADFHMGWHCESPHVSAERCAELRDHHWPENYPETAVTYFRWYWDDLEPEPGEIDFDYIDHRVRASNLTGQTLSFRVMAIRSGGVGVPDWLHDRIDGVERDGTFWPDYRDAAFQQAHRRFVRALADRYDDHPAVDHVDIGPVGCWGEWNTACIDGVRSIIEIYDPADDAERDTIAEGYRQVITDYADAFAVTPLVMLSLGSSGDARLVELMAYALDRGTGWRVDCWGDWGYFSPNWSHHENLYPAFMENVRAVYPDFDDVWQHAPVQLEVCGVMGQWAERGWSAQPPDGRVYRTFAFAIEHHAAVLNAKRSAIPDAYVPAMEDLLRRNGYRYVIDELSHPVRVAAGDELVLETRWSNLGVTPAYTRRTLAYRLAGEGGSATFETDADVRDWLPGTWQRREALTLPADLPPGRYDLQVALLDRPGTSPETEPLPPLQLGIEGRGEDGWYTLSRLDVPR